jgi:hypothetical protein
MDPLDMMADDLVDDASETGSLLGVKKRSRVKNSWFDDEADDDDGEVGEQGGDEDDENTTGKACNFSYLTKHLPIFLIRTWNNGRKSVFPIYSFPNVYCN